MQRRRGETSWLLPHRPDRTRKPGTAWRPYFSLLPVAFPREVTQVLDAILLRAASNADVSSVEVDDGELDAISGVISVSVTHVGERIPLVPIGRPYVDLMRMFDGFPASCYEIEINDGDQKLNCKQVLSPSGQSGNIIYRLPVIQQSEDTRNWTKVTFKPDFTVFNLINSDVQDIQHAVWKRTLDIAGTMGGIMGSLLKVRFRGNDVDVWSFYPGYVYSYPPFAIERRNPNVDPKRIFGIPTCSNPDHRWQVCVSSSHGEFEHISFVNGLSTEGGGTHVELVKKVLVDYAQQVKEKRSIIFDRNNKMRRGIGYDSRFDVEDICIFINLFINKPIFHSDAKNRLANEFEEGYKLKFDNDFLYEFVDHIMQIRPLGFPYGIPNLVDAREAGRTHSSKCYLILTNGESKILSGINYHDRKFYGVLSLQSKIPNAKTAGNMVFQNKDVRNIMASLGLEKGVCYKNAKKLRYAHIILMMNQDNDGAHIKGLIINLLHTWWPSLLLHKNFLFQFVIPIIKAAHHDEKHEFFSIREYNKWIKTTKDSAKWTTKGYKNLGAHTVEETKTYFMNKSRYIQDFQICGLQDSHAIDLVFSDERVNDRKDWIKTYEEGNFLDLEKESITYEDFFKKELLLYFIEDKKLCIPSTIGGYNEEDTEDTKVRKSKRRRKDI